MVSKKYIVNPVVEENEQQAQRKKAIDELLTLRKKQKPVSSLEIKAARHEGRYR